MIDAILHDTPPRDRSVPTALSRIIAKLLQKNTDNRYQSTKALMSALMTPRETVAAGAGEGPAQPATELLKASIAVLPFRNVGLDPANEYFCEGLAEELITALTKVEDVRVAARTSTFTFKGKDVDIREIGERLKVNAVLDGSVRKDGDRVRVTCQLLNTEDGYEIWSEQYDRTLADVFALQEEITRAIVDQLKVSLAEHLRQSPRTESRAAYHHYLKGRFHWSKRYEGGLKTAMDEFQNAIREDPDYAARVFRSGGHAVVHRTLLSRPPPRNVRARRNVHPQSAVARQQAAGGAHVTGADSVERLLELGSGRERIPESDRARSRRTRRRTFTIRGCSQSSDGIGRPASQHSARRTSIRFRRSSTAASRGCISTAANTTARSRKRRSRSKWMRISSLAYTCWEWRTAMKRQYADAAPLIERAVTLSGRAPFYLGLLGLVYGEMGCPEKVDRIIAELDEMRAKGRYIPPHCYVYIYAGLRDFDRALEWQEKACDDGAPPFYFTAPATDCLHGDPRHKAQMTRMLARAPEPPGFAGIRRLG